MKGKLMTFMILFIALDETVAIYWLIVALQILGVDSASMTDPHMFISAALYVWLPWIAVGIWEWYVAKTAVENMWKNPEISSILMVLTILWMALVESAAIYWLVVAFNLLWA
jgi:F0F1-type ATP synthase membrane subunit c/vacuolar-type H+-ATPase subunit K